MDKRASNKTTLWRRAADARSVQLLVKYLKYSEYLAFFFEEHSPGERDLTGSKEKHDLQKKFNPYHIYWGMEHPTL